jgi:hypothetical protein
MDSRKPVVKIEQPQTKQLSFLDLLRKYSEAFEKLKKFDSMVFVGVPKPEIKTPQEYRGWMYEFEERWMGVFNNNKFYIGAGGWNDEAGIGGYFSGEYVTSCKLYRFDAMQTPINETDFRGKRGYLIRDHYSSSNVVKVHMIVDNFVQFLRQENVDYTRIDYERNPARVD